MSARKFPELTYEEYFHAAAHVACRVERLVDVGCVALDQLIVKWYVVKVLGCDPSERKKAALLHHKYLGAIQRMIADGLLAVLETAKVGRQNFRALHIHPQLCASALWLSLQDALCCCGRQQSSGFRATLYTYSWMLRNTYPVCPHSVTVLSQIGHSLTTAWRRHGTDVGLGLVLLAVSNN